MSYFELELDYIHCPVLYIINLSKQPIFLIRLFQYSLFVVVRRKFPKFVCPRALYDCWKYNITLAIYNFLFPFRAAGYDGQFEFRRLVVWKCLCACIELLLKYTILLLTYIKCVLCISNVSTHGLSHFRGKVKINTIT